MYDFTLLKNMEQEKTTMTSNTHIIVYFPYTLQLVIYNEKIFIKVSG